MSAVNASFAKLLEYEQRAVGDAESPPEPAGAKGDWAGLAFRVGALRLVCGVDQVVESLPLPAVTRVPGTKPFILGLANVRGDLVTVVDLGCFLTGQRSHNSIRSRLLAATLRGRPVGLLVDEVLGQRNFVTDDAVGAELAPDSTLAAFVRRQHRSGSEDWQELDLDILFNTHEFLDGAAA